MIENILKRYFILKNSEGKSRDGFYHMIPYEIAEPQLKNRGVKINPKDHAFKDKAGNLFVVMSYKGHLYDRDAYFGDDRYLSKPLWEAVRHLKLEKV